MFALNVLTLLPLSALLFSRITNLVFGNSLDISFRSTISLIPILIVAYILAWQSVSLMHYIRSLRMSLKLIAFIVVVMLLTGRAYFNARKGAEASIEGRSPSVSVTFTWRDSAPQEFVGTELVLILYRDGRFYVVKKEKPAPTSPQLFIISDEQIRYSQMHSNLK